MLERYQKPTPPPVTPEVKRSSKIRLRSPTAEDITEIPSRRALDDNKHLKIEPRYSSTPKELEKGKRKGISLQSPVKLEFDSPKSSQKDPRSQKKSDRDPRSGKRSDKDRSERRRKDSDRSRDSKKKSKRRESSSRHSTSSRSPHKDDKHKEKHKKRKHKRSRSESTSSKTDRKDKDKVYFPREEETKHSKPDPKDATTETISEIYSPSNDSPLDCSAWPDKPKASFSETPIMAPYKPSEEMTPYKQTELLDISLSSIPLPGVSGEPRRPLVTLIGDSLVSPHKYSPSPARDSVCESDNFEIVKSPLPLKLEDGGGLETPDSMVIEQDDIASQPEDEVLNFTVASNPPDVPAEEVVNSPSSSNEMEIDENPPEAQPEVILIIYSR